MSKPQAWELSLLQNLAKGIAHQIEGILPDTFSKRAGTEFRSYEAVYVNF